MARLQHVTSTPWRDGVRVQHVTSTPWRAGFRVQSIGSPYTPPAPGSGTPVDIGSLAPAQRIDARSTYESVNALSVIDLRTDDELPVEEVSIELQDGSMFWQLRASGRFELVALLEAGEQPPQVEVTVNGTAWRFVIESVDAPQAFASTTVSIGGRSIASLADAPSQFSRQWIADAPTTGAQIATLAQTFTGLDIVWQAPDWPVPGNVWSFLGTPVGVIATVVEAIGGVAEAHRTEYSVAVRSRYPIMPNEWAMTPPDVQVAWAAVESSSYQRIDRPAYNAIILAGQAQGAAPSVVRLAGTSGADQAPMITNQLLTDLAAVQERGRAELGASDKGLMVTRTLQVLTGAGEPGVIERGALVRWVDPAETWVGMVRSVAVRASLSSVRQTIGCERRTAFPVGTVTPEPIDPFGANVVLQMDFRSDYTDDSPVGHVVTTYEGLPSIVACPPHVGSNALFLPSSTPASSLVMPAAHFSFVQGQPFTVEFSICLLSTPSENANVFAMGAPGAGPGNGALRSGWAVEITTSRVVRIAVGDFGAGAAFYNAANATESLPVGTWVRVAVDLSGSNVPAIYYEGTPKGLTFFTGTNNWATVTPAEPDATLFFIGRYNYAGGSIPVPLHAYIANIRITRNHMRHTGAYTPTVGPFPRPL